MAPGPLLLQGLQQEKLAVQGKQKLLMLLLVKQEHTMVVLGLWEDSSHMLNT